MMRSLKNSFDEGYTMGTLRLVLGDQLSLSLPSLREIDKKQDVVLMCEVFEEATYVKHHKKKIAFIFSAMRHFAQELKNAGIEVDYVTLDSPSNSGQFTTELERAVKRHNSQSVEVTFPGEYRVLTMMRSWQERIKMPVSILEDDRYLCSLTDFRDWAKDKKQLRMEYFYRQMRQQHHILVSNGKPEGGKWNYDAQNRKTPSANTTIPDTFRTEPDTITTSVMQLVEERFSDHFGDLEPFDFAVTREQALEALKQFIAERLPLFGDYQDAMLCDEPWMYHAHIAFYLNTGLLEPRECIDSALQAWKNQAAPLNAVEGFIRQILGWREYIRGIYWLKMPEYAQNNYFSSDRPLPDFFWTAKTELNCLKHCISATKRYAYAHHIQRLMVLGNFLLLIGVDPKAVSEWYLLVYADAFEWVELPNVLGMAMYADGGLLASKPYISGGAYIHKMSNYCNHCQYNVKEKTGPNACPFNYLYWNFLIEHQPLLEKNPRMAMMYRTLNKMSDTQKATISNDATHFIARCYPS